MPKLDDVARKVRDAERRPEEHEQARTGQLVVDVDRDVMGRERRLRLDEHR